MIPKSKVVSIKYWPGSRGLVLINRGIQRKEKGCFINLDLYYHLGATLLGMISLFLAPLLLTPNGKITRVIKDNTI